MYPTLQDIYNRDTIRKLYEIKKTKDFGYCPIVFRYPAVLYDDDFLNKRFLRLSEIWEKAKEDTEKAYPEFLTHSWRICSGYFNQLVFSSDNYADANIFFWKRLEYHADNEWKILRKFFLELNSEEIAICNADGNLNYYDKKNKELFEACSQRNFMKIKKAVENGADINVFDENGDTPLALVIESNISINDCSSSLEAKIQAHKIENTNEVTENVITILDYLLKKGANINLYGFDGNDCIYKAYGSGNVRVLNYLFGHGIRNDLNSFLFYFEEPEWYVNSNTYDSCSTNVDLGDWDVENQKQIISVLERNDCRYWIKDWNEEELKKYNDNLYNWMRSNVAS